MRFPNLRAILTRPIVIGASIFMIESSHSYVQYATCKLG
jgi:hypothetical protein